MAWSGAGILSAPESVVWLGSPRAPKSHPSLPPLTNQMQEQSVWKSTCQLYKCQQEWRTQLGYAVTIWFPNTPDWFYPLKTSPSGQRLLSKLTAWGSSGCLSPQDGRFQSEKRRGWVFLDLGRSKRWSERSWNCYSFVIHPMETGEQGSSSP